LGAAAEGGGKSSPGRFLAVLVLGSLVGVDPSRGTRVGAGQGCAQPSGLQPASCVLQHCRLPPLSFCGAASERRRTVVACATGVSACRRLARPGEAKGPCSAIARLDIKRTLQPRMGATPWPYRRLSSAFKPPASCLPSSRMRGRMSLFAGLFLMCACHSVSDTDEKKEANM
jgi:hypothetical protein